LTLNDGGVATYKGGSGTSALTFSYTAQAGQNAADLAATAFNLNSATIKDSAGNNDVLSSQVTNLSGTLEVNTSGNNEIAGNFNGTSVQAGNVIWFTAVLSAGGSPGNETFTLNGSHIYLTNGSTVYDIVVPKAVITYSNTTSTATTHYDATTNTWITNLPGNKNLAGNVFLTAVPFVVPAAGLPGGSTATWSIVDPQANVSGATAKWQWAAAV
jgi:hypothetical protein